MLTTQYLTARPWSAPALLDDDGTVDQLPTISNAGSKGWLITWSNASKTFADDENVTDSLNALDLAGCFFDAETNELSPVTQLTRTTTEDKVADVDPHVVYYNEDGKEYMKMYYTKSEYKVSNEEEGEVVGDILNPYQVIAVRNYDFENDTWSEDYTGSAKEHILESVSKDGYDEYVENWYGQEFLDLAPSVEITEELDEEGYWAEGTTADIVENELNQAMVKDGDSIAYNHLSLFAYTLDKGGMAQDTGDQNLYLQIYNMHEDTYHHPIQLTSKNAEISDIQFVRAQIPNGEETAEITYLYWLEDGVVKRINISDLVSNHLIESKTSAGQSFYYVDKAYKESDDGYEPEQIVAGGYRESEEDDQMSITNFKIRQQGDYTYTVWTQFVSDGDEENPHQELQLFAVRENTLTGETNLPVQLTSTEGQYIQNFDCIVTDDGSLDVMAECMTIDSEGNPDSSTAQMKTFHIVPSDKVEISSCTELETVVDENGSPAISFDVTAANKSLSTKDGVVIEILNKDGEVVSTTNKPLITYGDQEVETDDGVTLSNEATETFVDTSIRGGDNYETVLTLPLEEDYSYEGTVVVRSGEQVLASQELSGNASAKLSADVFTSSVAERNKVQLDAQITNDSVLDSGKQNIVYGYLNEDGTRTELGKTTLDSLASGETAEFSEVVELNFDELPTNTAEDGSVVNSVQFYIDTDADNTTASYSTLELTATAEEAELMTSLKDSKLSAKLGAFDEEGNVEDFGEFVVGDSAELMLVVDDEFAQNIADDVNRTKLVWTETSDDVVNVDRDGNVTSVGEGTAKLKGYVVPIDTDTYVYEDGSAESVDNYAVKPSSVIVPVEAEITVGEGALEETTTEPAETVTTTESTDESGDSSTTTTATSTEAVDPTENYFADVEDMLDMAKSEVNQESVCSQAYVYAVAPSS